MVSHEQKEISRRGFVGMLMTASAAFALASLPLAAIAKASDEPSGESGGFEAGERQRLATVEELPERKALHFSYPTADDPAILIHLPSGEFKAYNVSCTHLGCPVYWDGIDVKLRCPCHKGVFDPASGEPLQGPPKRPLHGVALTVENGVIYAIGRYQA